MPITGRVMMRMAHAINGGLQRAEAVDVVGDVVEDEVTTEAIDIVNENHAVFLQQEGEH
jgi:hypothetical protein